MSTQWGVKSESACGKFLRHLKTADHEVIERQMETVFTIEKIYAWLQDCNIAWGISRHTWVVGIQHRTQVPNCRTISIDALQILRQKLLCRLHTQGMILILQGYSTEWMSDLWAHTFLWVQVYHHWRWIAVLSRPSSIWKAQVIAFVSCQTTNTSIM